MPMMSVFAFERASMQQAGPFYQRHTGIDVQSRQLAYAPLWALPNIQAVVAYLRPDNEVCQSLGDIVNSSTVLGFVDDQFANAPQDPHVRPPTRVGPIRASYQTWVDILKADALHLNDDPGAHQGWEIINTISVDFHCDTEWYMSALKGTIILYAFYSLDGAGRPQVFIEGFSDPVWDEDPSRPDWGAAGAVSGQLAGYLSDQLVTVRRLLQDALDSQVGAGPFASIYTLPGTGDTANAPYSDNADSHVALCLVPGTPPAP